MLGKHKEILSAMLYLDTWRGRDSTGVAAIRHNADTAILKSTVPGYEFVEGPKLDQHLRLNDFCWIGHNRFGTIGKNIKTNAHPFQILDDDGTCLLVGAHNGTLKNKHVLADHVKFGTDSEALYNNIALEGLEESIKKVEGAWALTYYDHVEEELRFIRNKERTLFYAFEEDKKTLFWASEAWMIRVACSRANVKLHEDKVVSFNEDTLYRFPAPMKMNEELTMERKGGLVGKTSTFFQGYNRDEWIGGRAGHGESTTQQKAAETTPTQTPSHVPVTASSTNISTTQSGTKGNTSGGTLTLPNRSSFETQSSSNSGNVVSIVPKNYKGFGGVLVSRADLEKQLAGGCTWCEHEFISINERFAWLGINKPVCSKCLEGDHDGIELFKSMAIH
jgi:predicted glutamine amidotransferase